jgi:hypothetical protein
MSRAAKKDSRMVLGGSPRVHLLPPEVGDRKRGASIRRSVAIAVLGAVLISAAGYGYASWLSIEAGMKNDAATAETASLLAAQGEYSEVRTLSELQQSLSDARQVGAYTEIDWQAFYLRVVPTLPAGLTLTSFNVEAGSPVQDADVTALPGRTPGVATVSLVASTMSLASAEAWVDALSTLPDFAGASITSVSKSETGELLVNVELTLSSVALSNRYQPEPEPEPTVEPGS